MRFPGAILSATNVSFAYSDSKTKVLDNITLTIQPCDRVRLVGQNGGDKSTLVKILIGVLRPQTDTIDRHPRLRLGYFDQHFVEILSAPEVASLSALEFFMEQLKGRHTIEIGEPTGRSLLGSFGLRGRIATNSISTLSGGQKVWVHHSRSWIFE